MCRTLLSLSVVFEWCLTWKMGPDFVKCCNYPNNEKATMGIDDLNSYNAIVGDVEVGRWIG